MKRDYHLHTNYCKHSRFTVESLIEKAIEENFVEIGISEHIYASKERETSLSDHNELLQFMQDVKNAKAEYEKKIKILCGLELEMVDQFTGETNSELNNKLAKLDGIDYTIHSFHFYNDGKHLAEINWDESRANEMIKTYEKVISEQNVRYIAHPDAFLEGTDKFDKQCERVANAIGLLASKNKIILGLNVNGASLDRAYPSIDFWKIIASYGVDVKIELDAHSWKPFKQENIEKALAVAKAANVKIIEEIKWM